MIRFVLIPLPLLVLFAVPVAPTPAWSADRMETLSGRSLQISGPCARSVTIRPDPTAHESVRVLARADNPAELDQLRFRADGVARIDVPAPRCWRPDGQTSFSPTLDITVTVPTRMALAIAESGTGRYDIGDVGGPLSLDGGGAVVIRDEHVDGLDAELSGQVDLSLQKLTGNASIVMSGSGRTTLDQVDLSRFDLSLSGSGQVEVGSGTVAHAKIDASGVGRVRVVATVGDADTDVSGAVSVRFARVTGQLHREQSGLGSVSVAP
ncbi:GIN domain-containing protein [Rhizosaccharibacter radicis]|uniref:DUF2807 domain-containing protein n=1 Tax=Rhizosaccharibacter radicis TaxID=2782605 RepID=A0ABT1VTT8_9PROT|nr:DUF2807 domain-containing protein [Acetobacteraceae bacterium KSS12]